MKGDRYHLVELPMGWMVLLAGEDGLKRASLKPTPQEAIEDLGTDLEGGRPGCLRRSCGMPAPVRVRGYDRARRDRA